MMVNMTQIAKLGNVIVNVGASLYMFKKMGLFNKSDKTRNNKVYATDYYELVGIIIRSDMLDSYKEELIELVENNKTPGYYQAVADIVNGNMLTSTKVDMIKKLSLK